MMIVLPEEGAVTFRVAVAGVAGLRVAVMVSEPAETPVATPVDELMVLWAPVVDQATTQPVEPAATVLESLKVQKLEVWKLTVLEVTTEPGFGRTVIEVKVTDPPAASIAPIVGGLSLVAPLKSVGTPVR